MLLLCCRCHSCCFVFDVVAFVVVVSDYVFVVDIVFLCVVVVCRCCILFCYFFVLLHGVLHMGVEGVVFFVCVFVVIVCCRRVSSGAGCCDVVCWS